MPEEATLQDILSGGTRMRESQMQQDTTRIRNRFASNIVRAPVERAPSTHYPPQDSRNNRQRNNSNNYGSTRRREKEEAPDSHNIRIRNVGRSSNHQRSMSRNGNQRSREDMARMLEAMIGRKVF